MDAKTCIRTYATDLPAVVILVISLSPCWPSGSITWCKQSGCRGMGGY